MYHINMKDKFNCQLNYTVSHKTYIHIRYITWYNYNLQCLIIASFGMVVFKLMGHYGAIYSIKTCVTSLVVVRGARPSRFPINRTIFVVGVVVYTK